MLRGIVHELLTNEKYVGNNVYNRTSAKLQRPRVNNAPDSWVRCDGAYHAVVDAEVFATAQRIIADRDLHYTDDELLDRLKTLLKQHGTLSGMIINEAPDTPSAATYRHRFQNLRRAYELIGYTPARDYTYLAINQALRVLHQEHVIHIIETLTSAGAIVERNSSTDLLTVNHQFTTSLSIARCREANENYRWIVHFDNSLDPDITVVARMAPGNANILDYYLFPSMDVLTEGCRLAHNNGFVLDVYQTPDLTPLVRIARHIPLPEVA